MSDFDPIYMEGDAVFYVGPNERIKTSLTSKEGKPFRGFIHAPVVNEPGAFVVEFPDTKGFESYILAGKNLTKARPPKTEGHDGPEVQPRRQKKDPE